jgi:hypothetical protein
MGVQTRIVIGIIMPNALLRPPSVHAVTAKPQAIYPELAHGCRWRAGSLHRNVSRARSAKCRVGVSIGNLANVSGEGPSYWEAYRAISKGALITLQLFRYVE